MGGYAVHAQIGGDPLPMPDASLVPEQTDQSDQIAQTA